MKDKRTINPHWQDSFSPLTPKFNLTLEQFISLRELKFNTSLQDDLEDNEPYCDENGRPQVDVWSRADDRYDSRIDN